MARDVAAFRVWKTVRGRFSMFKLDDEEKGAKEKVLQEIMDLMDTHTAGKLKGMKKPAAVSVEMTSLEPKGEGAKDGDLSEGLDPSPEHEAMETPEEEKIEHETGIESQDELSEEEKAKITDLYNRFCK
jgi:hypothetical protein